MKLNTFFVVFLTAFGTLNIGKFSLDHSLVTLTLGTSDLLLAWYLLYQITKK